LPFSSNFDVKTPHLARVRHARLFGDAPEERAVIHRVISEFDSYSRHPVNKTERALFSGDGEAPPFFGPRPS
jgi:hypothetical protein